MQVIPSFIMLKNKKTGELVPTCIHDIGDYWLSIYQNPQNGKKDFFSKRNFELKLSLGDPIFVKSF